MLLQNAGNCSFSSLTMETSKVCLLKAVNIHSIFSRRKQQWRPQQNFFFQLFELSPVFLNFKGKGRHLLHPYSFALNISFVHDSFSLFIGGSCVSKNFVRLLRASYYIVFLVCYNEHQEKKSIFDFLQEDFYCLCVHINHKQPVGGLER